MRLSIRFTLLTAALLATLAGCSLFEEGEEEGGTLPPDMARRADGRTATAWPTSLPFWAPASHRFGGLSTPEASTEPPCPDST